MNKEKRVIAAASAYNRKYFINPDYALPRDVLKEIKDMCVLYSEKLHCVFSVNFTDDGGVYFETRDDGSGTDDIGAALEIETLKSEKAGLIKALSLWYRVYVLKENIDCF